MRATQMHRLLVGALAIACALSLGDTARADSHEGPLKIFSAMEKDFTTLETPDGNANVAGIMAVPGMGGGIARFEKGKTKLANWTYWYPEVVYVISGRGRVSAAAPPFTSPQNYDVSAGDFFFIAPSTRIGFEALSDDPFLFFYAVPE